jgi:hypothetical protein
LNTKESLFVVYRIWCVGAALLAFACASPSQQVPGDPIQPGTLASSENKSPTQPESKRIFGIVPNFRTSPSLHEYEPLTSGQKFKIASQDAFDRGTFTLAALIAGEGQLTNANRSFEQGGAGYARYFGASYGDLLIGDYMTEAIYPSLLHQDPRYFRRGTGSGWSRLTYAMGQIFWTHGDAGNTQFNFSEVIGNSTSVAISNAYYSDNRTASDAASKLGIQLGVDMAANILKEFWPDFERKLSREHRLEPAVPARH